LRITARSSRSQNATVRSSAAEISRLPRGDRADVVMSMLLDHLLARSIGVPEALAIDLRQTVDRPAVVSVERAHDVAVDPDLEELPVFTCGDERLLVQEEHLVHRALMRSDPMRRLWR
jgi:hypothetical protein